VKILFVGCRVRLVGKWEGLPENTPKVDEGVITEKGGIGETIQDVFDWAVLLDDGHEIVANSDELEPVLDLLEEIKAEEKELEPV